MTQKDPKKSIKNFAYEENEKTKKEELLEKLKDQRKDKDKDKDDQKKE